MSTNPMDKRESPAMDEFIVSLVNDLRAIRSEYEAALEAKAELLRNLMEEIKTSMRDYEEKFEAKLKNRVYFTGWKPIDATVVVLNEIGKPMAMDELIDRLKAGGITMQAGNSWGGADGDLKRSIGFFTGREKNPEKHDLDKLVIKERNDLIGLIEWDESMFQ